MTRHPTVSIIMPAYRARDTIAESIRSVQAQTLSHWELIIVDDGSPDDTAQVAKDMAQSDPRICVVQRCNRGPSIARNGGVDLARAEIIAFLDADDLWAPERLAGMVDAFAQNPRSGVLFSRTRFVDAETLKPGTLTPFIPTLNASDIACENALCSTSNIVCRKAVFTEIGGFRPGLNYAEDQDWLFRVALSEKWGIQGVDQEWFFYRSSPESQSGDLEAMRLGWSRMIEGVTEAYRDKAANAARKAYGPIHRQLARRALRMGQSRAAVKYLRMALRQDPMLLLRQPRRTLLTLAGTALSFIPSSTLKELVAQ